MVWKLREQVLLWLELGQRKREWEQVETRCWQQVEKLVVVQIQRGRSFQHLSLG